MKSSTQNLLTLMGGLISLYIAYITATGTILSYITFSDPLNEMAFCIASLYIGLVAIYCGIPQRHWNKLNPFA
tara:strand:- start:269 stop:487 length:219 start_codon:yes stop_codon:yes gene_type:complete